ncbi:MAG: GTPase Era [Deltaproteobacteria bacterium]|nr:GTPase Era [Deltaproteobacteria bacterium]
MGENEAMSEAHGDAPVPADFRSGFVAILGRPNVGKSTLLNQLLGEKIAIVSPRPQTTRNRIMGIKTVPRGQMLLLDTPGIHRARSLLNRRMVDVAKRSLGDVEAVVWVVDARGGIRGDDEDIAGILAGSRHPLMIALNKIDVVAKGRLLPVIARLAELLPEREIVPISARTGENVPLLVEGILDRLPAGPRYFPEDELTDQTERFIAAEIVREKVFLRTRQEIPYGTAVSVQRFEEKNDGALVVIAATIHTEREAHKPILIGKRGAALKEIGSAAREDLERLLGCRVYLELAVKATPGWSRDPRSLAAFGL